MANPSKLWKVLKSIGLPSNTNNATKVCLKDENNALLFEPKETCNVFKNFYENLAQSLVEKLPPAPNKFNLDTTKVFYEGLNILNVFKLQEVDQASILKMLQKLMQTKPLVLISSQVFLLRMGPTSWLHLLHSSLIYQFLLQLFQILLKLPS